MIKDSVAEPVELVATAGQNIRHDGGGARDPAVGSPSLKVASNILVPVAGFLPREIVLKVTQP